MESESDEEVESESQGNVLQEMNTTEDQLESEHPENILGTLPSSIESAQCTGAADNGGSADTVIKKNLTVKYKLKDSDYFKKAQTLVEQERALVNMVIVGIFKMKMKKDSIT